MRDRWERLSTPQKLGVVAVVAAGAPILIAGMIAGAKDSSGSKAAATPHTSTATTPGKSRPAAPSSSTPGPGPTFTYPGDPQCAITYQDAGGGRMFWTVVHQVAGELRTHATDTSATVYSHVQHVDSGSTRFFADVPLAQITDIGGTLDADDGTSYGCSVRPAP